MCQLKSGLVLKNRVFVPDYDSHEEMLKELGIEDNAINAMKTFVRFELSPKGNNIFSDIDTWELSVDQDILPDWWDEEEYKPKVVEAMKEWATGHIHVRKNDLVINDGIHYVKDSTVKAYHNSTVEAHGYSTVKAYDNSTVKACGMSSVFAYCKSKVKAYDLTRVIAYNDSSVVVYDNSTVRVYDNSIIKAFDYSVVLDTMYCAHSNIELFDKAICRDGYNKIYKKYDWEIVDV